MGELGRVEAERGYHPDSSVDRKIQVSRQGIYIMQIYILDIFDREPTHQDFILGESPQLHGIQRIEVLGVDSRNISKSRRL